MDGVGKGVGVGSTETTDLMGKTLSAAAGLRGPGGSGSAGDVGVSRPAKKLSGVEVCCDIGFGKFHRCGRDDRGGCVSVCES
jgi:hypothetical protein